MFANKTKIFSKVFFYIFVFLLPWQTRLILLPEKAEYLSFSIYLSEIFLWLALAFWLTSADLKKIKIPPVFLCFCAFVFLSVFWSPDKVAAFRLWLYIFNGTMIYLFLREHGNMRRCAIKIFLFSMFVAALFGIWQFFNLGSPAWKWLGLAERGAGNLGDIVVVFGGERWLRAYGPFPHPNIFGGYLAAGILLIVSAIKKNTPLRRRGGGGDLIIYFLTAILFFVLFLTFNRSAWIALVAALIYFLIKNIGNRGIKKFFVFLFLLAIALSTIFWPFIKTRATFAGRLEAKSNTERLASWRQGLAAWRENRIFGSGAGNYTVRTPTPYSQPTHNIFILVLAELGLAGFAIYLFVWRKFWNNPAVRPFLIFFFAIGILDHYLWPLYAGQMLFWLAPALFLSAE